MKLKGDSGSVPMYSASYNEDETRKIIELEKLIKKSEYGTDGDVSQSNSYYLDKLVLLDPYSPVKMRIPKSVFKYLNDLVSEHPVIKQTLLECKSPNYFQDLISLFGSFHSILWLKSITRKSINILALLTPSVIFDMLASEMESNPALIYFYMGLSGPVPKPNLYSNDETAFPLILVKWLVDITLEGGEEQSFATIFDGVSKLLQVDNLSNCSMYAQQALFAYLYCLLHYEWLDAQGAPKIAASTAQWLSVSKNAALSAPFDGDFWEFPFAWMMELFMLHPSFHRLMHHLSTCFIDAIKVEMDFSIVCLYMEYLSNFESSMPHVVDTIVNRREVWSYITRWHKDLCGKVSKYLESVEHSASLVPLWIDCQSEELHSRIRNIVTNLDPLTQIESSMMGLVPDEMGKEIVDSVEMELVVRYFERCDLRRVEDFSIVNDILSFIFCGKLEASSSKFF